jgi:hypothetical protein
MTEKLQILLVTTAVCLVMGILLISAAIKNWDWFFNSYKYRRLVKLIGRKPTRIIAGVIGGLLCLAPVFLYLFKW